MTDDGRLRLSDADRDAAAAELGEHLALGRLDVEEHAERLDAIWSARTRADLEPVFHDLPSRSATPARPTRGPGRDRGKGWHGAPFLPILVVLVVLTILFHKPFIILALVVGAILFARRRRHWHHG